ncbi:hypothetical protein BT63DRAFT_324590 [Microthyrium microscopicum]|uniref:Exoribonuclease phosphorolytic domain-containing protein n=1 Tax=Microthyrium microscopicum TaxID=703497 RepID=A0A6A6U3S0_9PEZI|nr:hypothetical protein BT63DRAFT_324590 [Microthyrium microscopicum]
MTTTILHPLSSPDGSATHTAHGHTITAAVNGPLEVPRRDELPEEATVELHIRPATGISTIRERSLELLLEPTIRRLIRTETYPRTLIQLTLQILRSESSSTNTLTQVPALLGAAMLALLDGGVALRTTVVPALAVTARGQGAVLVDDVTEYEGEWDGTHVFGITGEGKVILAKSEGSFGVEEWKDACAVAVQGIMEGEEEDSDEEMYGDGDGGKQETGREWLMGVMAEKESS